MFAGCSDFLDITPKDKQTADQLFSTKGGFYIAANGIYDGLASEQLYGRNLSYGAIEAMGKRYVVDNSNFAMRDLAAYSYTTSYAAPVLSDIWQKAYELILAANLLMDNIEKQEGILTMTESDLMMGEMLAVRAFLHLDMLRLFGPRWTNNPGDLAIPYNESSNIAVLPLLSVEEVMDRIIRDLDRAGELLAEDPIITNGPMASEVEGESVQLRYRQFRFNYYSTIALKARAYLWVADKENALAEAKRLLNDPKVHEHFPPVDPVRLLANMTNPDRVFSSEVLSAIYVQNRDDIYTRNFSSDAGTAFIQPYGGYVETLFTTGSGNPTFRQFGLMASETQDYRFQSQWEPASGVGISGHVLTKYKAITQPTDSEYFYSRMIPLVRLSEMYMIAAECEPNIVDGLKWLDRIRALRGINTPYPEMLAEIYVPTMMWQSMLSSEYLREFYGEGQSFYYFKRNGYMEGYGMVIWNYENGESANHVIGFDERPPLPEGEKKS